MSGIKEAYTTQELMVILGVRAASTVLRRAKREGWLSQPCSGRGGGFEWLVSSMPEKTRLAIAYAVKPAEDAPATVAAPALPNTAPLCHLSEKERNAVVARLAFVREIERLALVSSYKAAISSLALASLQGTLPARLAGLVPFANARYGRGESRGLSERSLYEWRAVYAEKGEAGLIPRHPQKVMTPPAWLHLFLKFWQRPQKPSIAQAHEEFAGACQSIITGVNTNLPVDLNVTGTQCFLLNAAAELQKSGIPSIYAVRRWLQKIALPEREAGRRTGNALLHLRPHKLRLTDDLLPTDVYTADGTTADVEVLHPYNGQPFKPELTFVVDVVTRRVVGVSVALAEDKFTILDALRMACCAGGIPAIFYTDNGPGYKNKLMLAEGVGMLERLGIEKADAIPGRPQGKGLMERTVQTLTRRLCKQFASCTTYDMDPDAAHKVFKLSRKQIKETGTSGYQPSWQEFLDALKRRVAQYNATPHRGLPRFVDGTGKRRNYSPDEYWATFTAQNWEPVTVSDDLREELFMPAEQRQVRNGWITFYNAKYFSFELADFHGERVQVRYDIWDPSKVYVWTLDGRKICTAELNGNAMPYFPKSRIQAGRDKREKAQVQRLEKKVQAVIPGATVTLPDQTDGVVIDVADSMARDFVPVQPAAPEPLEQLREFLPPVEEEAPISGELRRPCFACGPDRYEWLVHHPDRWEDGDLEWIRHYVQTEEYLSLEDYYRQRGLAWEDVKLCANVL